MKIGRPYSAKILLFGEYGIIKDAMGLSIPYDFYKGALKTEGAESSEAKESNAHLMKFCQWIEEAQQTGSLPRIIDTERMKSELNTGMYFDSSIPLGYGVGSSGAVVAAVYDRYAISPTVAEGIKAADIISLKEILGALESFFHGKSSGLDPLICYLNLPILIRSKEDIDTVGIPQENTSGKGAIFLLDSGQTHTTGALIDIFFEKMKNDGFRRMVRDEFSALSDACIEAFLNGRKSSLMKNVRMLSSVVLKHFAPMIPAHLRSCWEKGIETDAYYLKLCGAGGGGFMLGFTEDYQRTSQLLKEFDIQPIYRF